MNKSLFLALVPHSVDWNATTFHYLSLIYFFICWKTKVVLCFLVSHQHPRRGINLAPGLQQVPWHLFRSSAIILSLDQFLALLEYVPVQYYARLHRNKPN